MGYTHGKKWKDGEVEKAIMEIVNTMSIDYFPTKKEMIDFYGNNSLAVKVSKSGGSRYYADLLNLKMVSCESEFGNFYEEFAIDDINENTGLSSIHTNARYPYDLLTNGNIKVDVKVSKKIYKKNSAFPYYSFNLEKREPTCDLFIFYCLDNECEIERSVIIPSCLLSGKTQVGMGGLSKWEVYEDRWDYFKMYDDFYKKVKDTEVNICKRRSKPEPVMQITNEVRK